MTAIVAVFYTIFYCNTLIEKGWKTIHVFLNTRHSADKQCIHNMLNLQIHNENTSQTTMTIALNTINIKPDFKLCSPAGHLTFALYSWSEHTDSTGIDCRLNIETSREVGHILATVADSESVWAGVERDVGDGVGPISVVLDVNLSLGAAVWDDLDGQFSGASVGTVHNELPCLPDLGTLQTWARAAHLRGHSDKRLHDKSSSIVTSTSSLQCYFPVTHIFHAHSNCNSTICQYLSVAYLGGVCGWVSCGCKGGSRNWSSIIGQFYLVWPRLPGDELHLAGLWAQPWLHLDQGLLTSILTSMLHNNINHVDIYYNSFFIAMHHTLLATGFPDGPVTLAPTLPWPPAPFDLTVTSWSLPTVISTITQSRESCRFKNTPMLQSQLVKKSTHDKQTHKFWLNIIQTAVQLRLCTVW